MKNMFSISIGLFIFILIGCNRPSDGFIKDTVKKYYLAGSSLSSLLQSVPFVINVESTWTKEGTAGTYWARVEMRVERSDGDFFSLRSDWMFVNQDGDWRGSLVEIVQSEAEKAAYEARDRQDAILSDLNNLGADAYQWKIRPKSMGGGGGKYTRYVVNLKGPWGSENPNATYVISEVAATTITFTARDKRSASTVTMFFDANGRGNPPTYTGQFK